LQSKFAVAKYIFSFFLREINCQF